jgi:hypothetical protein
MTPKLKNTFWPLHDADIHAGQRKLPVPDGWELRDDSNGQIIATAVWDIKGKWSCKIGDKTYGYELDDAVVYFWKIGDEKSSPSKFLWNVLSKFPIPKSDFKENLRLLPFLKVAKMNFNVNPEDIALEDHIDNFLWAFRKVYNKPRHSLKIIQSKEPLHRVRRIPANAYTYLSEHSEDWQTGGTFSVNPSHLMTERPEEVLLFYENEVANTFWRNIMRYLKIRKMALRGLRASAADFIATQELTSGNKWFYQRMKELWNAQVDDGAEDKFGKYRDIGRAHQKICKSLERVKKLHDEFSRHEFSPLVQALRRSKDIRGHLRSTNILLKDSSYRAIYDGWQLYQRAITANIVDDATSWVFNDKDIREGYARFILTACRSTMHFMGFKPDNGNIWKKDHWNAEVEECKDKACSIRIIMSRNNLVEGMKYKWDQDKKIHSVTINIIPMVRQFEPYMNNKEEFQRQVKALEEFAKSRMEEAIPNKEDPTKREIFLVAHPSLLKNQGYEKLPESLCQYLRNDGILFWNSKQYDDHEEKEGTRRTGIININPLDVFSLERLRHVFSLFSLGYELVDNENEQNKNKKKIQKLIACPVCCGNVDDEGLCCKNSDCGASWKVITCLNCGKKYPVLIPGLKNIRGAINVEEDGWILNQIEIERYFGGDLFAPLCLSSAMNLDSPKHVCIYCGTCQQSSNTDEGKNCARCRDCRHTN